MAKFDKEIWATIAPRFRELRCGMGVMKFLAQHDLLGLKWHELEGGRSGLSVESLYRLCKILDVSATWLLFGIGRKEMSKIIVPVDKEQFIESLVDAFNQMSPEEVLKAKQACFKIAKARGRKDAGSLKTSPEGRSSDVSPCHGETVRQGSSGGVEVRSPRVPRLSGGKGGRKKAKG